MYCMFTLHLLLTIHLNSSFQDTHVCICKSFLFLFPTSWLTLGTNQVPRHIKSNVIFSDDFFFFFFRKYILLYFYVLLRCMNSVCMLISQVLIGVCAAVYKNWEKIRVFTSVPLTWHACAACQPAICSGFPRQLIFFFRLYFF